MLKKKLIHYDVNLALRERSFDRHQPSKCNDGETNRDDGQYGFGIAINHLRSPKAHHAHV